MEDSEWAKTFFPNSEPIFEALDKPQGLSTLRQFPVPTKSWCFGRRLSENNGSPIVVLRLYAKERGRTQRYAAKTFPEYTVDHAFAQWCRIPSSWYTTLDIQDEFNGFLNEARAYEHINRVCEERDKIFFPKYHGVLIPIDEAKFHRRLQPRNQAVVLESLTADTSSRRILCKDTGRIDEGEAIELPGLESLDLTDFERDWYTSLLDNRLRRVNALHEIGIVHNDISDRHFRIPGDFYDTVLYDFSVAYTFTEKWPYRMSVGRKPRTIDGAKQGEEAAIKSNMLERANQMDFRRHLANKFGVSVADMQRWFSSPLDEAEELDIILVKVMHRPDGKFPMTVVLYQALSALPVDFDTASISSLFPFLDAVCPQDDPTWLIRRARQQHRYCPAWVLRSPATLANSEEGTGIAGSAGELSMVLCPLPQGLGVFLGLRIAALDEGSFLLHILVPRDVKRDGLKDKLLRLCSQFVESGEPVGRVISRDDFDGC